jgi:hypothetical protein
MRSYVLIMMMLALPVLAHASDQCDPQEAIAEIASQKGYALSGPLSVQELEKENMVVIRETGQALPFGYQNHAWLELKAAMQPGDQIYFLSHRDGRFYVDYHVLVRDGCIIGSLRGKIT